MQIIKYKYIFLIISAILVGSSIVSIIVFGFKEGIDFAGGTMWEIKSEQLLNKEEINELFPEAIVTLGDNNSFVLRMKELNENEHQENLKILKDKFENIEELKFESIGPAIGREIRTKSIWAFILVLFAISLYITFAFRKVSYPVGSWKYGLITLLTLFHDAVIPVGFYAVLGHFALAEVGTIFIIAILVIIGFSVHDTIVVFDRIRENLRLYLRNKIEDFDNLVNKSVNETLTRSINTSLTLIFVLVALYFLGSPSLSYFSLVILTGTIIGTYSSIFIASPLLTLWQRRVNINKIK